MYVGILIAEREGLQALLPFDGQLQGLLEVGVMPAFEKNVSLVQTGLW